MNKLLIIDDDHEVCASLSEITASMGLEATVANTPEDGLALALKENYDLVLLDLEFPHGNGLQILPDLLRAPSAPEVIIVTGTGDINGAELAFKYGAWDYVSKPIFLSEISLPITRALQYRREKTAAREPKPLDRTGITGESAAIRSCLEDVARASASDVSVLITGETGTGKELFARAIHKNSRWASGNYVTVDCGALPESLAESTIFGHEKGAFTGAANKQEGVIVQAESGTLFLDEIGNLPLRIQNALLRALQERRIRPLGAKLEIPVNFKLVAATNHDLDKMTAEKRFRKDFLYRIRAIEIKLPPLRERGEDVHSIAFSKIRQICERSGIGVKGVSPEFMEFLTTHDWPGNVRELINTLEYALAAAEQDSILFPKHLPPAMRAARIKPTPEPKKKTLEHLPNIDSQFPTLPDFKDANERAYLRMLLERAQGDRKAACRLSGISPSRLYGLLKKHALSISKKSNLPS